MKNKTREEKNSMERNIKGKWRSGNWIQNMMNNAKRKLLRAKPSLMSEKNRKYQKKVYFLYQIKLIVVQELTLIRDEWSKIHERHPSKDIGLSIIDEFLSMDKLERCYVRPKKHQMKSIPTGKHLMEDVTDEDTFNHAITIELNENITAKKFIQGWMHIADKGILLRVRLMLPWM